MAIGKRRCDAVCHKAKHGKCGCICGGKFHGATVQPGKSVEKEELDTILIKLNREVIAAPSDEQPLFDFGGA